MSNCALQYFYKSKELREKYKIDCNEKIFENFDNLEYFNNEDFLKFIIDKYGPEAFNGDSPFTFSQNYINLDNKELCDPDEYSLKPQQKFVGQYINPSTNFNSTLVFHGLGSGKTCTSIVIGEAFKVISQKQKVHLLYVVPAPLVEQYYNEIIGELKKKGEESEIWSCTSQCVIRTDSEMGDYYSNVNDKFILEAKENKYLESKKLLNEINEKIRKAYIKKEDATVYQKEFLAVQNQEKFNKQEYEKFKLKFISKVSTVFEITTHDKFINNLFKINEDGSWTKKDYLTKNDSPLLIENGLLVIDEIQRLISESGILYQKLKTALYQYTHPKLRTVLLSATPIYDNPFELALTMNLLKPRVHFPITKKDFYSFFLGRYSEEKEICERLRENNFINSESCVINKELLKYLCSGYISYFKGGNPNAYPYKRIITLEHKMPAFQKEGYIQALASDTKKDTSLYSKVLSQDEFIIKDTEQDDKVSGIYIATQQLSNINLPIKISDAVDNMLSKKSVSQIKSGLNEFKKQLLSVRTGAGTNIISDKVISFFRQKGYSEKFASIIELAHNCNGPVFIFSNWLQFGVQALSIILDAIGYKKFPEIGTGTEVTENRYFIWSSETSIDKDLTSNARKIFNSYENRDGSKLKIILGTRSIMEGVSFKNVKQVHITDPWWNEARIEQILARAVRFCSHSELPSEEQYTDVYRHLSVLPLVPDPELQEMLVETTKSRNFKDFDRFSIDQKMTISAFKKFQINNEFEEILKETAIDCNLNKEGNIIRLEEKIIPVPTKNEYQIFFQNPKTLMNFKREGIPDTITYDDILSRKYSYPNTLDLPIKFTEVIQGESGLLEILDDSVVLTDDDLTLNLAMPENINCWNSNKTYNDIIKELTDNNENIDNTDIIKYMKKLTDNYKLLPQIRRKILVEEIKGDKIKFNVKKQFKNKIILLKSLKDISESPDTELSLRKKLRKLLKTTQSEEKLNEKIFDLVYKYQLFEESDIPELQSLNSKELIELLKEAEKIS